MPAQRDQPQYGNSAHLYSREAAEDQYRQQMAQQANREQYYQHQHVYPPNQQTTLFFGGRERQTFEPNKSETLQEIQALENGHAFGQQNVGQENQQGDEVGAYNNRFYQKGQQQEAPSVPPHAGDQQYWTYEERNQVNNGQPNYQQRVQSPSPPRQLYRQAPPQQQQQQPQQQMNQYDQFNQYQAAYPPYSRQQQQQQQSNNTWVGAVEDVYDGAFPSGPPPVFTTETPLQASPQTNSYKSVAERRRAESAHARHHHSPVEGASERGYLFGGMDFTDHDPSAVQQHFNINDYEFEGQEHRSRRDEVAGPPRRPGDFYGLDFLADHPQDLYADGGSDPNYKGYMAQQPRKHWTYTADANAPINQCETVVVESVNPVRLIGDTLSNQKVDTGRELTEEEKNTFATSFAPAEGHLPKHITVRPEPKSPEPICFSTSCKKELLNRENPPQTSTPGSRAQTARVQVAGPLSGQDASWYTSGNKEIMRNEPNWSRNVNQRRHAWEHQTRSVDSRMQLPSWAKVPPQQPPYWANRAHTTHNVWQSAADRGYIASGNYNTGYNTSQQQQQQVPQQPYESQQQQQKFNPNAPQQQQQEEEEEEEVNYEAIAYAQGQQKQYYEEQQHNQPAQQLQHNTNSQQQQQYQAQTAPVQQHRTQNSTYYIQRQEPIGTDTSVKTETFANESAPTAQKSAQKSAPVHQQQQLNVKRQQEPKAGPQLYRQQQQQQQIVRQQDFRQQEPIVPIQQQQQIVRQHQQEPIAQQTNHQQQFIQQPQQPTRQQQQNLSSHYYSPQVQRKPINNTSSSQFHTQNNYQRTIGSKNAQFPINSNQQRIIAYEKNQQRQQQQPQQFDSELEMSESLPAGQLSHSYLNTSGQFRDREGFDVNYSRELSTSINRGQEQQLLKQKESRVVDEPEEQGLISRF